MSAEILSKMEEARRAERTRWRLDMGSRMICRLPLMSPADYPTIGPETVTYETYPLPHSFDKDRARDLLNTMIDMAGMAAALQVILEPGTEAIRAGSATSAGAYGPPTVVWEAMLKNVMEWQNVLG